MSRTLFLALSSALCLVLIGVFTNIGTNNLPRWAERYKGYAWPALFVTVLLMLGLLVWQRVSEKGSQIASAAPPDKERMKRNRRDMLARVRHDWIDGVLHQSLYQVARIDLGLEDRPDAVDRPLTLVVQEAAKPARLLPPRTSIHSVFDAHSEAGGLLILGAPGAGKTTLLLELAEELLDRAGVDESHLIPVVFNLSSWAVRRAPLADWLMDELTQRYDVPRKLARHWAITGEQVLPLLDGLDEVEGEHRDACVERINEFRSQYFLPMTVCSRSEEYQRLSGRLRMAAAVVVQPLARAEVEEYLDRGGQAFAALRTVVAGDPTLREVLDTPLMLNVAMLAYHRVADHEALSGGTLGNGRRQLFVKYIDAMFERRAKERRYTREQTLHWLKWLASSMMRLGQSNFQLEALDLDWLPTRGQQLLFGWSMGLVFGLAFGLVPWLVEGLVFGLCFGIGFGLLGGLSSKVRPMLLSLLVVQLFVLVQIRLGGRGTVWFVGLDSGAFVGAFGGLTGRLLTDKEFFTEEIGGLLGRLIPNGGLWRPGLPALVAIPFGGLVGGLVGGLLVVLGVGLVGNGMGVGLAGLSSGLFGGFVSGLVVASDKVNELLENWSARIILWFYRDAPFQYVRFLDCAAERILLRKVGGGYIFVHRMLMEYIASLEG